MKTKAKCKNRWWKQFTKLPAIKAGVLSLCLLATGGMAQTYTILHGFTGGWDGRLPFAGLVISDTTLYGTTVGAGSSNAGTVFKVNTDGGEFNILKHCNSIDGSGPYGGLLLSDTILYGTTSSGGISNKGTLFKLNSDGSGYAVLKHFTGIDGGEPREGSLVLSGTTLYGTTDGGGVSDRGTIFKVNVDGSGFAMLKEFTGGDGASPGGLMLSGTTLYGTTEYGGSFNNGTVFKFNTDGSGFTMLTQFTNASDGVNPRGGLVLSDTILFGTTVNGGISNKGTVFKINTDGAEFSLLKQFTGLRAGYDTNGDGACPNAGLVLSGTALYGTTISGGSKGTAGAGSQGYGTIFELNTDGSGYAVIKRFTGIDGSTPYAPLALRGDKLYGTTGYGGIPNDWGNGVVFSLSLPSPPIIVIPPQSQTAEIGHTVYLPVSADGSRPLIYQWFFYGTNVLSGATNSVLQLTNVQPSQSGAYTVVITNALGAVTSSPAMLDVIAVAPTILTPPVSQTRTIGSSVFFLVSMDGSLPLSYQWFLNGTNALFGATNSLLNLTNLQFSQTGEYTVQITNAFGAITSSPAVLNLVLSMVVTNCTESNLRAAMVGGGTVTFACDGTITLSNTITNSVDTILDGTGHQVTISGGHAVRVFYVNTNVTFAVANLTIANGGARSGAGIFNAGGTVNATNSTFSRNTAVGSAGTSTSTNGTPGQDGCGGALDNFGVVNVIDCSFILNSAIGGEGGPGANGSPGTPHPYAGGAGGTGNGGAVCNFGALTMAGCTLSDNSTYGGVGGAGGNAHVGDPFGFPERGGGGGAGGHGNGGALFNGGSANLVNNTLRSNSGAGARGGRGGRGGDSPYNPDYRGGDGGGGGAGGSGFGAICDTTSQCYVTNCTLALNWGTNGIGGEGGPGGRGYGWPPNDGSPGSSGPNGNAGGGIRTIAGLLVNTLLATNTPGGNCFGKITDAGHNLSSDASCAFTNIGSLNSTDPKLGPLANNGGPTLTMALLPGSPAIDGGDDISAPSTDQRGLPRLVGAAADIGAFEYGSPALLRISRSSETEVEIFVLGVKTQSCRLLRSTTLSDWQCVATNQLGANGTVLFQDNCGTGETQRFYKVALP